MADVEMRKVRDEIVAYKEAHENPVIYDPLQVIRRAEVVLREKKKESGVIVESTISMIFRVSGVKVWACSHPEHRELVVDVLPHQRQVQQVEGGLLWSRYPENNRG